MRKIFLVALVASFWAISQAWSQDGNYRVHAVFLYNFTKYVQWPAEAQSGDFVIGVVGNSDIYDELVRITAGKTAGSQKIVVTKFKSADAVTNCHMVFVPATENFEKVQAKVAGKPVLLISEKPGLAQKGSNINFVIKDNKWRFELNENATRNAGLKIATELSKLAIAV
jgi:hypothetical protein